MPGERKDPYAAFNFLVEIDGITKAGFSEVSGLDSETDIIEYRTGDDKDLTATKLPGRTKYSNITLKRGFTDDASLWEWRKKVTDGKIERKNGSIILLNEAREEKIRWNFREGWPSKWIGPDLKADGNEVAIETLEIAHEGVEKA
jgi:phage tail-like protein